MPTFFFVFPGLPRVITCLITGNPFPREFRTFAISKIFINHVSIASLPGEISHVLVTSWGTGPICVVYHLTNREHRNIINTQTPLHTIIRSLQ